MGIVNMCRKFCEVWTCGFWGGIRLDRQTRQTYRYVDRGILHIYQYWRRSDNSLFTWFHTHNFCPILFAKCV